MSIWNSMAGWARNVADSFGGAATGFSNSMTTLAGWLNSFVGSSLQFFTHPVADVETAAADLSAIYSHIINDLYGVLRRQEQFIVQRDLEPFESWVKRMFASENAYIENNFTTLWRMIIDTNEQTVNWAQQQFTTERNARIAGDQRSEAYTRQRVQWALGLIQQSAASGYRSTLKGRQDVLLRLADDIITRDPLVRDLVSRVVVGILDLTAVEDPILRLALGFIIKEVIDRLGLDKAIGELLGSLLADILGQKQPDNLHDVIMSIGNRLNTLEGQWAQFMASGGPEILQAGREWEGITGILTDIGLAAFFGAMVADPAGWANDIATVTGPVVEGAVTAFSDTMKLWR